MIRIIVTGIILLVVVSCNKADSTPSLDMPYISSTDDMQLPLSSGVSIDTIVLSNQQIIFNNPYKYIGKLRLKGSMHNHTTNSDGVYSPVKAATKIKEEGKFDFYTITDHGFVTLDPMIDGIVWMGKSLEDTKGGQDNGQHLCIYNLPTSFINGPKSGGINDLIAKYTSVNSIVSYAHPDWWWQVQSSEKISGIQKIHFVEVLNSAVGGSERAYNLLLFKFGVGVYGFGVDDFHDNGDFNLSWIIAYANEKNKEDIWQTLRRGSFYSSKNDGKMEINCVDGSINVSTTEGAAITFYGKNDANHELGQVLYMTEKADRASYKITGNEGYIYVKVQKGISIAISQAIVILNIIPNMNNDYTKNQATQNNSI